MDSPKPIKCLVLDAGPMIKNTPAISSLIAHAESLYTTPEVISEIKDAATRSRVETLLLPFLTLRSPYLDSVKVVTDFARKTGDLSVLSRPDVQILALAYELECEKNGGNWRLRSVPGQKRLNGSPPARALEEAQTSGPAEQDPRLSDPPPELHKFKNDDFSDPDQLSEQTREMTQEDKLSAVSVAPPTTEQGAENPTEMSLQGEEAIFSPSSPHLHDALADVHISTGSELPASNKTIVSESESNAQHSEQASGSDSSDSEGWITPSNIKKKQAKDSAVSTTQTPEPKIMQVATLTTDFAMQNVLLQMNLNLLSPSLQRVRHLKTYILRCHACFQQTKDTSKQFCPRCGKPTLTRVACSTNQNGEFKLHLKANMQWNTRGDRYSIPKPVAGSAHGRVTKGGGKGGWGQELILAEDQKEYIRGINQQKRLKERDLMDEDYLPSILTGERGRAGGRPRIGAGRNVNSRKRH